MTLPELAKKAVETYIGEKKIISPPQNLVQEFRERKAGVFVTIEKEGELRGCIGTYLPVRGNLVEEIIYNAIAAATEDYRFGPIKKEELGSLSYTIYILNRPELVLIKEAGEPLEIFFEKVKQLLDPKKYGIIVKTMAVVSTNGFKEILNGYLPSKTGLLLPDLEGVETIEQQIFIACQKGGIDILKEKVLVYRFQVEKFQ